MYLIKEIYATLVVRTTLLKKSVVLLCGGQFFLQIFVSNKCIQL